MNDRYVAIAVSRVAVIARQHSARNSPSRNCLRPVVRQLRRDGRIVCQGIVRATRPLQTSESLERAKLTKLQSPSPASSL